MYVIQANHPDIPYYTKQRKEVNNVSIPVPLNHNLQIVYATRINKHAGLKKESKCDNWKGSAFRS
jgi:hypothetical protein